MRNLTLLLSVSLSLSILKSKGFLHTNGPLVHITPRATPIAIQNNQISEEDQQTATAQYFSIPLFTAINSLGPAIGAILGAVTATPPPTYKQQTLFQVL